MDKGFERVNVQKKIFLELNENVADGIMQNSVNNVLQRKIGLKRKY